MQAHEQIIVEQSQTVANAKVTLHTGKLHIFRGRHGNGKLRATNLLPAKEVAHRFNRLKLIVKVWFKVQFHS